jgi:hypothetical protein
MPARKTELIVFRNEVAVAFGSFKVGRTVHLVDYGNIVPGEDETQLIIAALAAHHPFEVLCHASQFQTEHLKDSCYGGPDS